MLSYPLSSLSRSTLPSSPGVYIFRDSENRPIYIGKAKNLSHRVSSYFRSPRLLGEKTSLMVSRAISISLIQVGSEIEAILLESKLINIHQPFFNLISKDDKSPYFIHLSADSYPKPIINHESAQSLAGPFLNNLIPRRILKLFRKLAPYCTASKSQKHACLYSHLGLCNPCPYGDNFSKSAYQKNIRHLRLLLSGKFVQFRKTLMKQMLTHSKNLAYEKALEIKNQLDYLDKLMQRPILPEDYLQNPNLEIDKRLESIASLQIILKPYYKDLILSRLETYDIANIQGQNATAAMTVCSNGSIDSQNFRHFKIKTKSSPHDPAMLFETVSRRLTHLDWPAPNLIVLDGGVPQLSIFQNSSLQLPCPVISLSKRNETIIICHNHQYLHLDLPKDNPGLRLLQHLRDEAHRFSRRLFHKYQSDKMIS